MKIKVSVPQVITQQTNLKNKDGSFAIEQVVLLHVEGKLAPIETTALLRGGIDAYPVGEYALDPASFASGNYGRLEFRLRVGPKLNAPAAVAKAA